MRGRSGCLRSVRRFIKGRERRCKKLLDRIIAMLTKLGQRGYTVREGSNGDDSDKIDCDTDTDSDTD